MIAERVRKVISEQLGVKPENDTDNFTEDLGANSFDCIELVMGLEREFGIKIPDEDAAKLLTVKDVITYVEAKICPGM